MWCLLSICANSFPLLSLSLASYGDEQLGDMLASDTVGLLLSLFLLLHLEPGHNMEPCYLHIFLLLRCYGATDGDWAYDTHLLVNTSQLSLSVFCSPFLSLSLSLFTSTFHPPHFTQDWILSYTPKVQFQLPWLSG